MFKIESYFTKIAINNNQTSLKKSIPNWVASKEDTWFLSQPYNQVHN
jgi:hypothetical protein